MTCACDLLFAPIRVSSKRTRQALNQNANGESDIRGSALAERCVSRKNRLERCWPSNRDCSTNSNQERYCHEVAVPQVSRKRADRKPLPLVVTHTDQRCRKASSCTVLRCRRNHRVVEKIVWQCPEHRRRGHAATLPPEKAPSIITAEEVCGTRM